MKSILIDDLLHELQDIAETFKEYNKFHESNLVYELVDKLVSSLGEDYESSKS